MNFWILPSNEESFHLEALLKETDLVDWIQHNNFEVGDVVFIYNSRPWHRITHMMSVERVNVPSSEYMNDRKFWVDIKASEERLHQNRFVRLRWLSSAKGSNRLTMDELHLRGINGNIQGARKVPTKVLLEYILKAFES